MDQEVPASAGRTSFRATWRAIPVPLLVTVRVNPMASPAEIEALTGQYATSLRDWSSDCALPVLSDPSLVVVTLAVLSTGEDPAVAAVVGERSEERRVGKEGRSGGAPPREEKEMGEEV